MFNVYSKPHNLLTHLPFYGSVVLLSFGVFYHGEINGDFWHEMFEMVRVQASTSSLVAYVIVYLFLCRFTPKISNVNINSIRIWNIALAVVNGLVATCLLISLVTNKMEMDFYYFLINCFAWFKVIEFGDSVLLRLKGRDLSFLQVYHHATVFAYTWITADRIDDFWYGTVFAVINGYIHLVMYFYYFWRIRNVKVTYGKYLTQAQIAQMVFGLVFSIGYVSGNSTIDDLCLYGAVMYLSYLLLVVKFYCKRYNKIRKKTF